MYRLKFPGTRFGGCIVCMSIIMSLAGCTQMKSFVGMERKHPRFPALVVTEPNFKPQRDKQDGPFTKGEVVLNLSALKKSDSELWQDFFEIAKDAKHWRVLVTRFSDESDVTGFDWVSADDTPRTLKDMPLDVLMRAIVDLCYDDDPDHPKSDQQSRSYIFLLHHYPEEHGADMKAPQG